jgi:peptidoglycan/xylan/chitin deacetylase (PgdA/CDA1 family)
MKFWFLILLTGLGSAIFAQQKMVAITIDDLPFVRIGSFSDKTLVQKTDKLLSALEKQKAPAIGFVNLSKVYKSGVFDSARYNLLRQWLVKGFDLGNHTFSHPDFNNVSFGYFIADLERNEPPLKSLLKEYRKPLLYFRHPFLHRGNSKAKADSLAEYLSSRRYTEAPVTIDNSEWIFAAAYDSALKTKNKILDRLIGAEYLKYMESKVKYFENQSDKLFARNIRQILLIHANSLNADYLGDLLIMFKRNGYTFVNLATALRDELYQTEDLYFKNGGISWLDRWAITREKSKDFFKGEPVTPSFIMKLAKVESE